MARRSKVKRISYEIYEIKGESANKNDVSPFAIDVRVKSDSSMWLTSTVHILLISFVANINSRRDG